MRRTGSTALAAALAVLLATVGCASLGGFGKRRDLEEAQKKYVRLLRWGEYDAASFFVSDEVRTDFREQIPALEDVRFSDYEIIDTEFTDDSSEARVLVSYRAYHLHRMIEHAWSERQTWEHTGGGEWRVTPDLEGLRTALHALDSR